MYEQARYKTLARIRGGAGFDVSLMPRVESEPRKKGPPMSSDRRIQTLTRAVAADPGDEQAANALGVALVRAGRGPAFAEFLTLPDSPHGNWGGPRFGPEGRYRLSIQAGSGKYSDPRRGGLDAADYSEWELALVDYQARELVTVPEHPVFGNMPHADHWEGERQVGPYVPAHGVQAIFDWLTLQFGRPLHPRAFALED